MFGASGDLRGIRRSCFLCKTADARQTVRDKARYENAAVCWSAGGNDGGTVPFAGGAGGNLSGIPAYRGYPVFSAPDEYLYAIKEAGFDVLLTANNHCLDKGKLGLERTILMLDSLKIHHAGTYRNPEERHRNYPLLIEKNGFRIVLLNYTYGTNGFKTDAPNMVNYINREQIKKDILDARRKLPDVIIACMHWGVEYCSFPERSERELAGWLIGQGVDHVIGSHPHVLQPMEYPVMLIPLGINLRSSLLWHSLVPFSQEE